MLGYHTSLIYCWRYSCCCYSHLWCTSPIRRCTAMPHMPAAQSEIIYAHNQKEDTVAHLAPSRGHCTALDPTIPSLQVSPSFTSSVASLSRCPSCQLPGWHSLHCGILADYLLDWGRVSTCSAGHTKLQCTSMSKPHKGDRRFLPVITLLLFLPSCLRHIFLILPNWDFNS